MIVLYVRVALKSIPKMVQLVQNVACRMFEFGWRRGVFGKEGISRLRWVGREVCQPGKGDGVGMCPLGCIKASIPRSYRPCGILSSVLAK